MPDSEVETIIKAGRILIDAGKCLCPECVEILDNLDEDFYKVSTRLYRLTKTNPGLVYKILTEEWSKTEILEKLPELYE
jgi:hypothetical protein